MKNTVISQTPAEQQEQEDPLVRLIYAVGLVLTAFGGIVPGHISWSMVGVAMIAFCYLYE